MNSHGFSLIFDCDGVLADTERFGHLPAFNAAFVELGVPMSWSEDDYARLVQIGGGKERIEAALAEVGVDVDPTVVGDYVKSIHAVKTRIYRGMVDDGVMPPRAGVSRLICEALAEGWNVAVASTSAVESVRSVLGGAVGDAGAEIPVFAGDMVPHKKPAPDIYQLAIAELAADPSATVVIEDSAVGLRAARAAGLACVVTPSSYTHGEDFSDASAVVSTLGDAAEPTTVLADPYGVGFAEQVDIASLRRLLSLRNGCAQMLAKEAQ
ncbi:HAD-IA family hydrolase [Mycolicibacterium palauense]|uniref:HAD-IA family hydrolase n=1 Tax=Mycolicibacterium palauense TaxID=2034511 RepID=UPI000BFEE601|nr:HAD-IA family hydrolase [Mycolicibacterium palauense]